MKGEWTLVSESRSGLTVRKEKIQGRDEKYNINAGQLRCSQPGYKGKEPWKEWKTEQGQLREAAGQG